MHFLFLKSFVSSCKSVSKFDVYHLYFDINNAINHMMLKKRRNTICRKREAYAGISIWNWDQNCAPLDGWSLNDGRSYYFVPISSVFPEIHPYLRLLSRVSWDTAHRFPLTSDCRVQGRGFRLFIPIAAMLMLTGVRCSETWEKRDIFDNRINLLWVPSGASCPSPDVLNFSGKGSILSTIQCY